MRSHALALSATRLTTLILLAVSGACATSGVRPRAVAVSDADREAKRALAMENQLDAGKIPARTFSVLPFAVATRDTLLQPLGHAMADFLITDLAHSPQLQLLERQHTDAMLRELDMIDNGLIDPRTGPRVGRLVGARRILVGDMSAAPGGNVVLNARVVDVIAGSVEQLVTATAPLARIIDAEKQLALRLFEQLGITLTPAQRAQVEQRQSTNLAATLAYGRGVDAEARGDAAGAMASFQEAVRLDATFAAARVQLAGSQRVTAPRANSGIARVLSQMVQAINAPATTRIADAADLPLQSNQLFTLLLTIRVF